MLTFGPLKQLNKPMHPLGSGDFQDVMTWLNVTEVVT